MSSLKDVIGRTIMVKPRSTAEILARIKALNKETKKYEEVIERETREHRKAIAKVTAKYEKEIKINNDEVASLEKQLRSREQTITMAGISKFVVTEDF